MYTVDILWHLSTGPLSAATSHARDSEHALAPGRTPASAGGSPDPKADPNVVEPAVMAADVLRAWV